MARYQIWDKLTDIYTPSGDSFTAQEWADRYKWVRVPGSKMIITTGPINGGVAMEFTATKEHYRRMGAAITDDMTEEEVLAAIEEFEDNPPVSDENTPEERIAAALELQNLMALPDVHDEDPETAYREGECNMCYERAKKNREVL